MDFTFKSHNRLIVINTYVWSIHYLYVFRSCISHVIANAVLSTKNVSLQPHSYIGIVNVYANLIYN